MRCFTLTFGILLFGCGPTEDTDGPEPQWKEAYTADLGNALMLEEALVERFGNGELEKAIRLAPPPAGEALDQIPDLGRKLLALRSYLRAGSCLTERWSWTEQEIKAFEGSVQQLSLLAEVAAVRAHFAKFNPGYEIYANTRMRSLDVQIANWNENASVGLAAQEILVAWKKMLDEYARLKKEIDPNELRDWLSDLALTKRANLAAPGLTLHGRAHAIDFQISRDGKIIGGADTNIVESFWRAEKWDQKLKASIEAAGPSFDGPLTSPDEPWHYSYEPPDENRRSC